MTKYFSISSFLFTAVGCQDLKYIFLNSMAIKGKNSLKVSALIQLAKFNLYCQYTELYSRQVWIFLSLFFQKTHLAASGRIETHAFYVTPY